MTKNEKNDHEKVVHPTVFSSLACSMLSRDYHL